MMNTLLIGLAIFVGLIGILLALPFTGKINWQKNYRRQQNIALYQHQIASSSPQNTELHGEFSQRLLTDEKYLQYQPYFSSQSKGGFSGGLWSFLSLVLIAIPLLWYFSLARYEQVQQGETAFLEQRHKLLVDKANNEQEDYLLAVQDRLRQDPNDAITWLELGQIYMQRNEWDNALVAFSNAERLQGSMPEILGFAATALYLQSGEKMTPKVQQLLDVALQQDPNEISALSLLATEAFKQQDYPKALQLWQQVLDSGNHRIDRHSIIQRMKNIEMLQGRQAQ